MDLESIRFQSYTFCLVAKRFRRRPAQGYGLVAALVALLVLGGLATVVLTTLPGSEGGSTHQPTGSLPGLVTAHPPAQISTAAEQACEANYLALQQAISVYQVEHRSLPKSLSDLDAYFHGSASTPQFSLTIDPSHPGQVEVQTEGHTSSDGDVNCRYA